MSIHQIGSYVKKQRKQLEECYYLGDMIQAQRFQNYIMDQIIQLIKTWSYSTAGSPFTARPSFMLASSIPSIQSIYENTSEKSLLRKLLVAYHLGYYLRKSKNPKKPVPVTKLFEFGCQEYVGDMLQQVLKQEETENFNYSNVWLHPRCSFHNHIGESENFQCQTTQF
jgi:hypothetical protein